MQFGSVFSGFSVALLTVSVAGCSADATSEKLTSHESALTHWTTGSPKHVVDWDSAAFALPGPLQARTLAILHPAQFDAINSIVRRYEPFKFQEPASANASTEAAAIQAAYRVILRVNPAGAATYDALRASGLATIPDGPTKDEGVAVGDAVGNAMFESRVGDGSALPPPPYTPLDGPQYYQLTPPNFAQPVNTGLSAVRPFTLLSADQFLPPPPRAQEEPILHDPTWTRDFNEVKTVGRFCSDPNDCPRTVEQHNVARFFNELAHQTFFRMARKLATEEQMSLYDAARFFSHLALANYDGSIGCFQGKYAYNMVRPVTAIRNAANDGNAETEAEANWLPGLTVTPNHPEYPAGHGYISGSMLPVMEAYFGQTHSVDLTSNSAQDVVLHFDRWSDMQDAITNARVWAGFHYRTTMEISGTWGNKVGKWVVNNTMRKVDE